LAGLLFLGRDEKAEKKGEEVSQKEKRKEEGR